MGLGRGLSQQSVQKLGSVNGPALRRWFMMGRTIGARVEARCFQSSGGADPGGMARPPLCICSAFKWARLREVAGCLQVCGITAKHRSKMLKDSFVFGLGGEEFTI